LALAALTVTVFVCVAEPSVFGTMDWVRLHGFYKPYIQASVARGRLPLWNPYVSLGRPLLAEPDSAFFYPPDIVYLFLDVHLACILVCTLHILLCLYGTVKLARAIGVEPNLSLAVAAVFATSAPVVGCFTSGYIHYGPAICFIPLLLYLGMRVQAAPGPRPMAAMALALGLLLLCGHPQAAWLAGLGVIVFMAARRIQYEWRPGLAGLVHDLVWMIWAATLGAGLAAVSLLPLAELVGQSNRQGASLAFSAAFAEPAFGWATLLVPTDRRYFHFQANAQLYAGVAACVLGVCGLLGGLRDRNLRALFVLAIFAAFLAAGDATPLFTFFFHVLPGVSAFRIHSRATLFVSLALVLAAGSFLSRPLPRSRFDVLAVMWASLAALAASVTFVLAWPGYGKHAWAVASMRAGLVIGTALLAWLWLVRAPRSRLLRLAWAGWLLLDLGAALVAIKQQNRDSADESAETMVQQALAATGHLVASGVPPRVFIPAFRENAGMEHGWSSPYGYVSLTLGRVWNALHAGLGVAAPVALNTFPSPEIADHGPFPYHSMALVLGVDPQTHHLRFNPDVDPRAYLTTAVKEVRDDKEAIALMRAGHDFHRIALVEQPLASLAQAAVPAEPARATITRFQPEEIAIDVDSSVPALLVLAEPWFPGWTARVNGGPETACLPANAWMRAIAVPPGKSQVIMSFHSTYLVAGSIASLAALVVILALLLLPRRRRVQSQAALDGNAMG
jgi:hypothetical protein